MFFLKNHLQWVTGLTQDTVMTLSRVFDEATFSLCLLLTCCAVSLPSVWSSVSCMQFRIIKDSPSLCASLFVALPLSSNDQMPSVFWCILKLLGHRIPIYTLSGWVKLSSSAVISTGATLPFPLVGKHAQVIPESLFELLDVPFYCSSGVASLFYKLF